MSYDSGLFWLLMGDGPHRRPEYVARVLICIQLTSYVVFIA